MPTFAVAAAALLIELILGYPAWLFRLLGHPVVWIGALIDRLDRGFNRVTLGQKRGRLNGVLALLLIIALPASLAWLLQFALCRLLPHAAGLLLLAAAASTLLAQRSLHAHVRAVADGLRERGIAGGREAVSHIVGRDAACLDEPAVVRAAIESLAENFSDGVVAPLLWCALLGLPGIVAYKAINTADSMIGHRTPRHRWFGWASARLDDLVNLPASRLAALWITLAAGTRPAAAARAARTAWRDAGRHRSPNAGWPEAAMAGALGIRLAGPRTNGAVRIDDGWIGDGDRPAVIGDLHRALEIYRTACAIQLAAVLLLAGWAMWLG